VTSSLKEPAYKQKDTNTRLNATTVSEWPKLLTLPFGITLNCYASYRLDFNRSSRKRLINYVRLKIWLLDVKVG